MSHLVTGRHKNKILLAFTSEVEKRQRKEDDGQEFGEILNKSFKKASLKASKLIQ